MLRLTSGTATPTSTRSVMPTFPKNVAVFVVMPSVSVSTSNGAASSENRFAVVVSSPVRRWFPSSEPKEAYCSVNPSDAWPAPAVSAFSTKNGPNVSLARSTVPSVGFNRYEKPLDDVLTGSVATEASSARVSVSRVASAASRSLSKSLVCTPWFVTRNRRMS